MTRWSVPAARAALAVRWAAAALGSVLAGAGMRRRSLPEAIGGGALLFLSLRTARTTVTIEESVTVLALQEEVYRRWVDVEALPGMLDTIESVRLTGEGRSTWVARLLQGRLRVAWEAELVAALEPDLVSWRTLPGSEVRHSGSLRLREAPGHGTEVHVRLEYHPPGGLFGKAILARLGPTLAREVREGLRCMKRLIEAGEIPTTRGQPAGRAAHGGGSP